MSATPQSDRGQPSESDTGTWDGMNDVAEALSEFARTAHEQDPADALAEIVSSAVKLIPGCEAASISLVIGRREVICEAASGDLSRTVDALQVSAGQGPCLDAAYEQSTVRVEDMASETRWPEFSKKAFAAGAGSMLAFQLFVEEENLGALNLFSSVPHAFDDESEHIGLLFAAHAAVAYSAARRQARMDRVMESRLLIGQAEGILMERHKVTAEQAFAILVTASQRRNRKLRDLAADLVRSGTIESADVGSGSVAG